MKFKSGTKPPKVHVTFSIPEEVNALLHLVAGKRGLSKFVARVLQKALEDEQESLRAAYAAAEKDTDRKEVLEDFSF
jgi:hypothetical protein